MHLAQEFILRQHLYSSAQGLTPVFARAMSIGNDDIVAVEQSNAALIGEVATLPQMITVRRHCQEILHHHSDTSRIHAKISYSCTELQNEREYLQHGNKFLSGSAQRLKENLQPLPDQSNIYDAVCEFIKDLDSFTEIFDRCSKHQAKLRQLASQSRDADLHVSTILVQLASILNLAAPQLQSDLADAGAQEDSEGRTDESSEADIHPLPRDYYNSAQDHNMWKERLLEIEDEYEEQHTQRQLLTDQDRPLEQTETEFQKHFKQRKADALNRMEDAAMLRETARAACIAVDVVIPGSEA